MVNCYECGKGKLIKKKVEYEQYSIPIGKYSADVCNQCKEVFFDSEVVGKIEEELKKRGLWGLGVKTRVGTSGNALDIKLGKGLIDFFHLRKGQTVLIEPKTMDRFEVEILDYQKKI